MSAIKINKYKLFILAISILYAGISSSIFLGFRAIDLILIAYVFLFVRIKINIPLFLILISWIIVVLVSSSLNYTNKFLLSDLRFLLIIVFGILSGYSIGKRLQVDLENLYYSLIIITIIIYLIILIIPAIRTFYIPESFQKDEHENTIFGPSFILINYLYIYLIFKNRRRTIKFFLIYFFTILFLYFFRQSRLELVTMLFLLFWSYLYSIYENIKLKHILITLITFIFGGLFFYINFNERLQGILHPKQDSSYIYRLISNELFIKKIIKSDIATQLFGLGPGSTIDLHLNDWLGTITFFVMDNGLLTILMKTGLLGLVVFILILLYPLKGLSLHKKIILLTPIVLSMLLFGHIIYNVLFIFSLYFTAIKLKNSN